MYGSKINYEKYFNKTLEIKLYRNFKKFWNIFSDPVFEII